MNSISIGIPTYKRPDALMRRLDELSSVFPEVHRVFISDNDPASIISNKVSAHALAGVISYNRNQANVGACANFIKIVEMSDGGSLWFRGDDDRISSEVVQAVRSAIIEGAEIVIFTSLKCDSVSGEGLADFCNAPYAIRASRWLSAVVIPSEKGKQCLEYGYFGVASGWPHVTLILGILQKFPSTKFKLISLASAADGFRDVGRDEGMKYAYFRTGIEFFPDTSLIIGDSDLRKLYLRNWRMAFDSKIIRVAVRMRLGFMAQEEIRFTTISPLIDWRRPALCVWSLVLWGIGRCPRAPLRMLFSVIFSRMQDSKKRSLGFEFLVGVSSLVAIYRLLRERAYKEKACIVY